MSGKWFVASLLVTFGAALLLIFYLQFPFREDNFSGLGKRGKERKRTVNRVKRQDSGIGDESQLAYEVKTSALPMKEDRVTVNDRYMPTMGNGHLGATVYGPDVFLAGLYSGRGGSSHRARIPAIVMSRIYFEHNIVYDRRTFTLNAQEGVFTEYIDCDFALIEHRTYIHQKYIRLLVSYITARRKPESNGGIFRLRYPDLNATTDIVFEPPQNHNSAWKSTGYTTEAEDGAQRQNVYIYFKPLQTEMPVWGEWANTSIFMAIDKIDANARNDFDEAMRITGHSQPDGSGHQKLLQEHIDAWKANWDRGKVELESSDLALSKITWFSQYYLLSNLPSPVPWQAPQHSEVFFGVGRGSLARGSAGKDYQGHIFWDSEMYVMPAMLLFYPDSVKRMLRYRSFMAEKAKAYAESTGHVGYRYPWESAFSGNDVTPDNCTECRDRAMHVSAAVNWAARQYYSATRDRDYMTNPDYKGCDISRETARFYANMAVYNASKGRYDINGIMGPDDWRPNVSNNAYTNAMASLAIHWARYFACVCDRIERTEVPDEWVQKALYLYLPYDNVRRIHYEYEGYDKEQGNVTKIKQADAILLGYPINWNASIDILRNDLYFYEMLYQDRTPAMTYSFMTVGWKWINEPSKYQQYFRKSYQDYMIQPFKVWTEFNERNAADQATGVVNYLPGMGAFMQSILYGFAGIRLRPQALEFHNPMPPPGANVMRLRNLRYLGNVMTVEISNGRASIDVHTVSTAFPLVLKLNGTFEETPLIVGQYPIPVPAAGFYIYTTVQVSCYHPRDYIYMPWGYSPWISGAPSAGMMIYRVVFLSVAALFVYL